MKVLAAALLFLPLVAFDLDLDIPPGMAMEWGRDLGQPVPTGYGSAVPSIDKRTAKSGPGSTVVEEPKPIDMQHAGGVDYSGLDLYGYVRVISHDIMSHVGGQMPKSTGRVSQDEVSTGGPGWTWNYPPELPAECFWVAAAAYLRHILHPEVTPWPEIVAMALELGEPAYYALTVFKGMQLYVKEPFSSLIEERVKEVPKEFPVPPKGKDEKETLIFRVVAVELTSGYPYAIDPTYARRTLSMGKDAYPAVLACTRNAHPFLARNAVAVLAHFMTAEAAKELLVLAKETRDPVIRARAMLALARRGDKSVSVELMRDAENVDPTLRALGLHGLGVLSDSANAKTIADLVQKAGLKDPDLLWNAIPALGRMRSGKEVLLPLDREILKKTKGSDRVRTHSKVKTPEDGHAQLKVLRQMVMLALAMNGERVYIDELNKRAKAEGLDTFYPVVHNLAIEALAMTDEGSSILRKQVIDLRSAIPPLLVNSLRLLARYKRIDAASLKAEALDEKNPASLRAVAIQLLAEIDPVMVRDVTAKLVADFAEEKGGASTGVVTVAARIGGPIQALNAKDLPKALDRAWRQRIYARREGVNSLDLTKAVVTLTPPLVETLAYELGRLGDVSGVKPLEKMFGAGKPPGGKPEAALGLGAIPGREADEALVGALEDTDGWTRWCAYRALMSRGAPDHFCDWIFGDGSQRGKATEAYRKWLKAK